MIKGPIGSILPPGTTGAEPPDHAADQLRLPTLDERASLFLRAVHGERDFTDQERSDARDRVLDEMANHIAVESEDRLRDSDWPGMPDKTGLHSAPVAVSACIPDKDRDWAVCADRIVAESADHYRPVVLDAYAPREGRVPVSARHSSIRESLGYFNEARRALPRIAAPPEIELPQQIMTERRVIAWRRIFAGSATIAATVLVLVGAYRFAWLPVQQPTPESRVAVNQRLRDGMPDQISNTTLLRETGPKPVVPLNADAIADMVRRGQASTASGKQQTAPQSRVAVNQRLRDGMPDQIPNITVLRETSLKPLAPAIADAIADMVRRGRGLTAGGKILAARSVLREAADANNAEAALALGMTYDPVELDSLGVRDGAPEADTARRWYQKAQDLGSIEAEGRLERLAVWEGKAH